MEGSVSSHEVCATSMNLYGVLCGNLYAVHVPSLRISIRLVTVPDVTPASCRRVAGNLEHSQTPITSPFDGLVVTGALSQPDRIRVKTSAAEEIFIFSVQRSRRAAGASASRPYHHSRHCVHRNLWRYGVDGFGPGFRVLVFEAELERRPDKQSDKHQCCQRNP